MNRSWRLILAILASSVLALIIGLLSNVVADTLVINPRLAWIALGAAFLLSLPITLYLFLHEEEKYTSPVREGLDEAERVIDLPDKSYQRFFGRDRVVDDIMSVLREPERKAIIGLDGMGGIGKTALAREVVDRCLSENLFDSVIWEPKPSEIEMRRLRPLTWVSLVTTIGSQLGAPDITALQPPEKEARLASLLETRRVLLVLDNLEAVVRDQDKLAERLLPLFSRSKCIMTSRRRFAGDVYTVHVMGLDEASGTQLLRYEAAERRIERVAAAKSRDLLEIVTVTGGSPLAMKLVVGQLQHLPLGAVLQSLQEVQLDAEESDESDYIRFYKSIFWNSWQLLDETAQRLLVSMAVFAPGVGGTLEAIQATSNLNRADLLNAVDELWRFSFLETGEKELRNSRHYLHPLTHNFVSADIIHLPSTR